MSKEMNVVRSGDCIGFLVDNFGFLTTPSSSEPLPEREEVVTHLRASNFQTENALTSDFYRNMFRIENDLPQVWLSWRLTNPT